MREYRISCRPYGVDVNLRGVGIEIEPLVEDMQPPVKFRRGFRTIEATTLGLIREDADRVRLEIDGETLRPCYNLKEDVEGTLHDIIAKACVDPIFVHAGAVSWQGRALLVPGATMSGKSTLVEALVHAGAGYLSDEYALVDAETGLIKAFPRRLRLRHPRPSHVTLPPPSAVEVDTGIPPALILTIRHAEAGLHLEPISAGAAALAMFNNTIAAEKLGATLLPLFGRMCLASRRYAGTRGEAAEAARHILALFNERRAL